MNSNKILIIEAKSVNTNYWHDIFGYRDLFYMLVTRDLSVRYKQTVIGVAWALIRPLITMIVFSVIFGSLAKLPSSDMPYPLVVFSAMVPWFFFSSSVSESSYSLVANGNLLTKVYFPRIILPASAIAAACVDFLITLFILLLIMLYYGYYPNWRFLIMPFIIADIFILAFGFGLWFSALNARYRDFQFVVPYLLQFGLYLSPVGFMTSIIPKDWIIFYSLNPMVGVIDAFRWIVLGGNTQIQWEILTVSIIISFSVLISGLTFFRYFERSIADVI